MGGPEVQSMAFRKKQKTLQQYLMATEVDREIPMRQRGTLPVADDV